VSSAWYAFVDRVSVDALAERDAELATMRACLDVRAEYTRRALHHLRRACFAHGFHVKRAVRAARLFERARNLLLRRAR
jgi:hypothetical protein